MNTPTMHAIRVTAFYMGAYWKWKAVGPESIRAHNLKVLRKDLACLCAIYRVEQKRRAYK